MANNKWPPAPALTLAVWAVWPSGTIDGKNAIFTLIDLPAAGTLRLYINGIRQIQGVGYDYSLSGKQITCSVAPKKSSTMIADYSVWPIVPV